MNVLLPAVAVVFAAFCVWLTVRIVNRRERWAKWTLAASVGLPALYAASFGPACWVGGTGMETLYQPILRGWSRAPEPLGRALYWYANLLSPCDLGLVEVDSGWCVLVDGGPGP